MKFMCFFKFRGICSVAKIPKPCGGIAHRITHIGKVNQLRVKWIIKIMKTSQAVCCDGTDFKIGPYLKGTVGRKCADYRLFIAIEHHHHQIGCGIAGVVVKLHGVISVGVCCGYGGL